MRNFFMGFLAFPLLFDWLPQAAPYLNFLQDKPLWFILAGGPLVMLLLWDWDWKHNLSNRYARYQWERKQRLLKQLKQELGEQ